MLLYKMQTQPNPLSSPAARPAPPRSSQLPPARPSCSRRTCAPQLIAAIAEQFPDSIALTQGSATLTYRQLETRANQMAAYLTALGVEPEVPVAVCLERSFEYVIAALAVWKAGGAYLPLDPAWPLERREAILQDAAAEVLITRGPASHAARHTIDLDKSADAIAREQISFMTVATRREHLAYIIYTSGTTGKPKGVEVTHGNLLNLIFWHRRAFSVTAFDHASHLAGLGFDAAVWELWPYLTAGASVALADDTVRTSPELLRDWLVAQGVTIAFAPTALAEPRVSAAWPVNTALRYLLTGADTLHRYPADRLPFRFINNYGPTECTVVATSGAVEPEKSTALPSIGKGVANTSIYVLDENRAPVAPGEIGEIYIGGSSVARGYRNRPALTAERFFDNPFSLAPGARMYRTGDLGCVLPDGKIAFRGRADAQEKIRGHRVEPDEIAALLDTCPGVLSSAVAAKGEGSEKRLVAYYVSSNELDSAKLRDSIAARLPDYMVPSAFVRLNALPLTDNGKIDRAALPEPSPQTQPDVDTYRAPSTPLEKNLAGILAELLHLERVGLDDNFLLLGGHSLLGAQVILRARERFGVELGMRDLFQAHTVAALAAHIEQLLIAKLDSISDEEAERLLAQLQ